jgi:glycosyltransferase involved in cell wall biosynthesis
METEEVTVAIVTRDRPGSLRRLLESLVRGDGCALAKVVVVDDSPVRTDLRREFPQLPIDYVPVPGRVFISKAKNLALTRVVSEWVCFIDDDNLVPQEGLSILARDLSADRKLAGLMPSVAYARRPDLVWVYACPFRPGRWDFELIGRNRPRDPAWEGRLLPTDALPNASMLRTDLIRGVGGFEERLPVNSSAELCFRLKREGYSVQADSRVLFLHDVDPPGVPGYWAQHAYDPERVYHEVKDWLLFRRALHPELAATSWRFALHAFPFVASVTVGLAIRGGQPFLPPVASMVRGYYHGIREVPLQWA